MDGSQKLPQRLLAACAARLDKDQPIDALALAVAGWMRWQDGVDDAGNAFTVDDPLAAETARLVAGGGDYPRPRGRPADPVGGLPARPRRRRPVCEGGHRRPSRLVERGAEGAVEAFVESLPRS